MNVSYFAHFVFRKITINTKRHKKNIPKKTSEEKRAPDPDQ